MTIVPEPINVVVQTMPTLPPGCIESIREWPGWPRGTDGREIRVARVRWLVDACEVALHNCELLIRASGIDLQREMPDPSIVEGELRRLGVSEHVGVAPVVCEIGTTLGGTVWIAWPKDATMRDDVMAEAEQRKLWRERLSELDSQAAPKVSRRGQQCASVGCPYLIEDDVDDPQCVGCRIDMMGGYG